MIYSRQRELVLNALRETQGHHPTADMLYTRIREQCPNLSLATVYRNLNQLVEAGQFGRFFREHSAMRFPEASPGVLHHLRDLCPQYLNDVFFQPRNITLGYA